MPTRSEPQPFPINLDPKGNGNRWAGLLQVFQAFHRWQQGPADHLKQEFFHRPVRGLCALHRDYPSYRHLLLQRALPACLPGWHQVLAASFGSHESGEVPLRHLVVPSGLGAWDVALDEAQPGLRRAGERAADGAGGTPAPGTGKLFEFGGSLYCFAFIPKHDQVITLAVDRIKALEASDETFAVSPNLSFQTLRDQAFGVIGGEPMTVEVQFRQDQVPYVKERIWDPTQSFEDLPNGETIMTFQGGGEFEIVRWLLGWGSAAKVLERNRSVAPSGKSSVLPSTEHEWRPPVTQAIAIQDLERFSRNTGGSPRIELLSTFTNSEPDLTT